MKGSRPEQAVLTRDTDMSKTDDTRRVIETMVDGLNDHRIDDIGEFFSQGFRWMGNQGCGTKTGLQEFQDNWQRPFQAAFSDKVCIDEARLYMGEWAAAFGRQEATHSGEFLGHRAHRKTRRNPLHGFLESGRRQDRRQLGERRFRPCRGPAWGRSVQWRRLGSLRSRGENRPAPRSMRMVK